MAKVRWINSLSLPDIPAAHYLSSEEIKTNGITSLANIKKQPADSITSSCGSLFNYSTVCLLPCSVLAKHGRIFST
jgi:hypothetical protein